MQALLKAELLFKSNSRAFNRRERRERRENRSQIPNLATDFTDQHGFKNKKMGWRFASPVSLLTEKSVPVSVAFRLVLPTRSALMLRPIRVFRMWRVHMLGVGSILVRRICRM